MAIIDCHDCKPRSCPGKSWYSYGDIRYCREQMRWGIVHLDMLTEGIWPADPEGSSYIDPDVKTQSGQMPEFIPAAELAAEIDVRLACAEDGDDLIYQLQNNGIDTLLTPRAKLALNYISGWRRKRMAYSEWKKQRQWRNTLQ